MTRTPHDNFAKDYFEELLSPLGKIEISREITDEARQPLRGSQKSKVKSQK